MPSANAIRIVASAALLAAAGCAHEHRTLPPAHPARVTPAPAARAAEPAAGVEVGLASYYGKRLVGHRTASGERYDPNLLTAAHRSLSFGTMVEVRRPDGRSVVVRINDRGPFVDGRVIDVSRRAAEKLEMIRAGTVTVELRPLPVR